MSTPAAGPDAGAAAILSPAALEFVQDLNRRLGPRRDEVLARRVLRRDEAGRTGSLDFLPGTAGIRDADWVVPPARAEIARSQLWQWVHCAVSLQDGEPVTADLVRRIEAEVLASIRAELGGPGYDAARLPQAAELFERVALAPGYVDFLTVAGYDLIGAPGDGPAMGPVR